MSQIVPLKLRKTWDKTNQDWPLAWIANRLKAEVVLISQQNTAADLI